MASHSKRLPHFGPSLPTLSALQSISPHHHSSWRLHPPSCPLSTHSYRPGWSTTFLGRISLLPHRYRSFHAPARSLYFPRYHGRNSITCLAVWLGLTISLSTDHHHRPRTPVRVTALPQPGEAVRYPSLQDDSLPSRSRWPRGAAAPHAEGLHYVPCRRAVD